MASSSPTPVVLIHGLFQMLRRLGAEEFFAPRPVMIPDLPGYGDNRSADSRQISLAGAVDYAYQQMHAAGYKKAHISGHSVGGAVAMLLAGKHPEVVASVVNVEGNFTLKDAFWSAKIAEMPSSAAEALIAGYQADPAGWLRNAGIMPTPERIVATRQGLYAQPASTVQAMARSVVHTTGDSSYLQGVKAVFNGPIPVSLLAGERSRAGWDVPDFALKQAASFTIQPGVGHMMMLEDPSGFFTIMRKLIS